jgi:hypothetical protein
VGAQGAELGCEGVNLRVLVDFDLEDGRCVFSIYMLVIGSLGEGDW